MKNILKSSHCTAILIRRAMECSNVIIMLKAIFMFCYPERKYLHSCGIMSGKETVNTSQV